MINSDPDPGMSAAQDQEVRRIVAAGSRGALVLAGIATALVIAMWLAFYFFVFVPRASVP